MRRDGVLLAKHDAFFKIDASGVLSIIGGNEDFQPGRYEFDLKLNTYIVGDESQEGIYQDALTINVTSGPLAMSFSPSQGKVEAGLAMRSKAPTVRGSKDGLDLEPIGISFDMTYEIAVAGRILSRYDCKTIRCLTSNIWNSCSHQERPS